MRISSDQHIIDGILNEETRILKSIYLEYYPGILRYILSTKGTSEEAKDIFQDALVVIFIKARKDSEFLKTSFKTYLFAVCKLLWLKERQRSYRSVLELDSQFVDLKADEEDIIADLVEMEKNKLVWKHFRDLNEECKKIIHLTIDRTPLELITEIMGFSSVQYTKNRKTICKNNLVKKIRNSPEFKELRNEKIRENTAIPRW